MGTGRRHALHACSLDSCVNFVCLLFEFEVNFACLFPEFGSNFACLFPGIYEIFVCLCGGSGLSLIG